MTTGQPEGENSSSIFSIFLLILVIPYLNRKP
jgi:hypothetical protein